MIQEGEKKGDAVEQGIHPNPYPNPKPEYGTKHGLLRKKELLFFAPLTIHIKCSKYDSTFQRLPSVEYRFRTP